MLALICTAAKIVAVLELYVSHSLFVIACRCHTNVPMIQCVYVHVRVHIILLLGVSLVMTCVYHNLYYPLHRRTLIQSCALNLLITNIEIIILYTCVYV